MFLFWFQNSFAITIAHPIGTQLKTLSINGLPLDTSTGAPLPPADNCKLKPTSCDEIPPNCLPKSAAGGGKEIVSHYSKERSTLRESQIEKTYTDGHLPDALENLRPVSAHLSEAGETLEIKFFVMPDYLAVGNNSDYVRTPMTNVTAQHLGDRFGMTLPTSKMVDLIYFAADKKITGDSFGEEENKEKNVDFRSLTRLFLKSDEKISKKLVEVGGTPTQMGEFIAGHKKDVILSPAPGFVSIYGWACAGGDGCHMDNRMPRIQNVNDHQHSSDYDDYSHGIRLVNRWVYVTRTKDGQTICEPHPLEEVLADKKYCEIIGDHCPLAPSEARAYMPIKTKSVY